MSYFNYFNTKTLYIAVQLLGAFLWFLSFTSWECQASAVFYWCVFVNITQFNFAFLFAPKNKRFGAIFWELIWSGNPMTLLPTFKGILVLFFLTLFAVLPKGGFWFWQKSILRTSDDGWNRFNCFPGMLISLWILIISVFVLQYVTFYSIFENKKLLFLT